MSLDPQQPCAVVVDDDLVTRIAIQDYLEEAGINVIECGTGEDALELLDNNTPDLLLLDVGLPGIDGNEVCRRIRATGAGAHLPIVMVTGNEDIESVDRAYDAGATDFVAKPLNFPLLIHRLRFLLRAKAVSDQLRISESRLAHAQKLARLGSWELNLQDNEFECSEEARNILFGKADKKPVTLQRILEHIVPEDRPAVAGQFKDNRAKQSEYDVEFRFRRDSNHLLTIHQEVGFIQDDSGKAVRAVGTFQDVTEDRAAQEQIRELAFFDNVTGLPNRAFFMERLSETLAHARRKNRCMALMFVDLDQFKRVNDSWGHHAGDELLRQVSSRLQDCLRRCDVMGRLNNSDSRTLARLGGDEFVVLLSELNRPEEAGIVARRILDELKKPFVIENTEVHVSGSIGISSYPADGDDEHSLLRHADVAMYQVKEDGRNSYRFFMPEMNTRAMERLNMEASLWRALERSEFCLHYQPKVNVNTAMVTGAEALIRWEHPQIGLVSPGQFIPVAEESGIIVPLGTWVLQQACRQAHEFNKQLRHKLEISVNLSAAQFNQDDLLVVVEKALAESGLNPELLQLELTESMLMGDIEKNLKILRALRDMGIKLAIDDFGTGYSSLNYLKILPIDVLKIDRSFVRDLATDERDSAIVRSTITLAHNLGLQVIAEGVEQADQETLLLTKGCDELQGYYYSRPLPPKDFLQWVAEYDDKNHTANRTVAASI